MRSCSGARWPWSFEVLRQSHRDQSSNDISHVAASDQRWLGRASREMKVWRFQGLLECSNDSTTEGTMIHRYELRFLGRSGSCFQAIERDFFSNFLDAWGDFLSKEK